MIDVASIPQLLLRRRLLFGAFAVVVIAALFGIGLILYPKPEPPKQHAAFTFQPNTIQVFHIHLTPDILLQYESLPSLNFNGDVVYEQKLWIYIWDPKTKQYYLSTEKGPDEIIPMLNQIQGIQPVHPIRPEKEEE